MEVLACSDVQCAGESDCGQQSSGRAFVYGGESSCINQEQQDQGADGKLADLNLTVGGTAAGSQCDVQGITNQLPSTQYQCSGPCDRDSHDVGDDIANGQHYFPEPCIMSENSHPFVEIIKSESPNDMAVESSISEPSDTPLAVLVKWGSTWQAGIRCARADWPLSTVRAKPTHDRTKYILIFFPHKRNYCWTDMLLVHSINDLPEPTVHEVGLHMVKDLNVARQFIMRKMAAGILDIVDQFHTEALIEAARDLVVWKEFAMEASRCTGYADLGRMLLKMQSMILPRFINSDWLSHFFHSWVQKCEMAHTAETVEILREELNGHVLWNEVKSLRDAAVLPTFSSEWNTWKYEVMQWSSTSYPLSNTGEPEHRSNDPLTASLQVSRKRPKLEVRRADLNSAQHDTKSLDEPMTVEIDTDFFNTRAAVNMEGLAAEPFNAGAIQEGVAPSEPPSDVADKWGELVIATENSNIMQTGDVEPTPLREVAATGCDNAGTKNRQCTAYIESKGRQCVRWANDGDAYCCVHLASRFGSSSTKMEGPSSVSTQMCEGTTVLGTKCKHRALYGSSYCKKHVQQTYTKEMKRKYEETLPNSEPIDGKELVPVGDVEKPLMGANVLSGTSSIDKRPEHLTKESLVFGSLQCIGLFPHDSGYPCLESPKKYSLYCDKHLPNWLKRARNGKSRLISKEVFMDLLKDCCSQDQKLHLHQACELFYKLFKSIMSLRNPVPKEVQFQWALSEASKDFTVGKLFLKLVNHEKERLKRIWGFSSTDNAHVLSTIMEEQTAVPSNSDGSHDDEKIIKCKICSDEFLDINALGNHWMENHKKESQWLFRGYACSLCLDSFTNKKLLEPHVQERHHVQFGEECVLLRCIPCGSHFGDSEKLWLHVLSAHPSEFQPSKVVQQQSLSPSNDTSKKLELGNPVSVDHNPDNVGSFRKFICRFCGLKFDLLPDLGRHHQAAHMGPSMVSSRPAKRGVRFHAYRLKSGRLSRPKLRKGLGPASYNLRNKSAASLKQHIQAVKSIGLGGLNLQPSVTETATLGKLEEPHCSAIAKILCSGNHRTKPRPSNADILAIARSACCKVSLKSALEEKYGSLSDGLYLKAAKLCSEQNIQVVWHQDQFICPQGCRAPKDPLLLSPLMSLLDCSVEHQSAHDPVNEEVKADDCHVVINWRHLAKSPSQKAIVLCEDMSFGQEPVPVVCVVDEHLSDPNDMLKPTYHLQNTACSKPWESFTYVTKPLLDHSVVPDMESLQLGCACPRSTCHPQTCDHVYLFDNDYEDAKDINGKSMQGRFPYDENGRNILEEGYLVYECNHLCSCSKNCPNRVLQNGLRVRLEVFKTAKKGWAVRAGEAIPRGTFVCEYIGEVLDDQEASTRRNRYGQEGGGYFYYINASNDDMGRSIESQNQYVIDATQYGNVSRFISHSRSPNLISYQVLIESMECRRAHIGLYASRDIALGEELTCCYQHMLASGQAYA